MTPDRQPHKPMHPWPIPLAAACLLLPSLAAANALADDMDASTVRVICLPKEGDRGAGSGFVVGHGDFVVTNHYVIACTKAGGRPAVLLDAATRGLVPGRDGVCAASRKFRITRLGREPEGGKHVCAGHGTVPQPRSPPARATVQP